MACLSFSREELYSLWRPFRDEPDGGLEALCGFLGLSWDQNDSTARELLREFQERYRANNRKQ